MKLAVLYSGGKDSNYALYKASINHEIECLINLNSANEHSYMFQKPGNEWIDLQAEAMNIPLIRYETKGEKESELQDLKDALSKAINQYNIQGLVTGAIQSVYQASRVQKICYELNIYCFNPLWQIDEKEFLEELIKNSFEIKIIGIASWPLCERDLGIDVNTEIRNRFLHLQNTHSLSPIGEGGEFETFVLDSPIFNQKIKIEKYSKHMDGEHSGILKIERAKLVEK